MARANVTKDEVKATLENAIQMIKAVMAAIDADAIQPGTGAMDIEQSVTIARGGLAVKKGGQGGCSCG
jgi:hypothetical protein